MIKSPLTGIALAMGALMSLSSAVWAGSDTDPLGSEGWQDILEVEFDGAQVVYDDSLYLVVPERVEEAFSVPVVMNFVETNYEIAEIALFAENNPFPTIARIFPQRPINAVGFNIRLEQSTPVRVAAMDSDGVWHVVSREVHVASPGGCSAGGGGNGALALGEIATRQFVRADGDSRLKVKIGHPMHTGLVLDPFGDAIPEFYIQQFSVSDDRGELASMQLTASVAADPVFMFELPDTQQSVRINATDTEGDVFEFEDHPSSM
jgi:sulfur-oxidizing protein SoxY